MLCFKTENVIASIMYGGVSKKVGPNFTYWGIESELRHNTIVILAGEWTATTRGADGHASLMIDILTVYIFSISTYTMLKKNVHEGLF